MTAALALDPGELTIVRDILSRHVPSGFRVFLFGSRVHGHAKPWSDLDILIEGKAAVPLSVLAALRDAFDESPLTWKVDLVDRAMVDDAFAAALDSEKVPLD